MLSSILKFRRKAPEAISLDGIEEQIVPSASEDALAFDRYVSLGQNCEVGFQLKRVLGASQTGFFNWILVDPAPLLSLLRSDFSGIMENDSLSIPPGEAMVFDASHGFLVHHEFDKALFRSDPLFDEKFDRLRAKFLHFADAFRREAETPGRTAYFFKCMNDGARDVAIDLRDELARYQGDNPFHLIVLQTADKIEDDWSLPGISNRYLKRFAPILDAPDAHVPSWDAVFQEFPHRKKLNLANYHVW